MTASSLRLTLTVVYAVGLVRVFSLRACISHFCAVPVKCENHICCMTHPTLHSLEILLFMSEISWTPSVTD